MEDMHRKTDPKLSFAYEKTAPTIEIQLLLIQKSNMRTVTSDQFKLGGNI